MTLGVAEINGLVSTLKNRTIRNARLENNTLTIDFHGNTTLIVSAESGPGADSNWYTWTKIAIDGKTILDK